jgi:hypothetical protein
LETTILTVSENFHDKREWIDDEMANLIQLYEEHEFLWNVQRKLYRNRGKK